MKERKAQFMKFATPNIKLTSAVTAVAFALGSVAPALAQETVPPAEAEAVLPDALLTSFVTAVLEINTIAETYRPRIEAAEDPSTRAMLEEEAQTAMVDAIEQNEGITVEEYLQISQAARTDQGVNAQVMQRLQEMAPAE
jgi:hypothetical protein